MDEHEPATPRWRENLIAVLIFLALLGLLIFTAGSGAPFVYGRF
jgi:hypothetical protein